MGVAGGRSESDASESSVVRGTNVNELTVEFEVGTVEDLDDDIVDGALDKDATDGVCSMRACHSALWIESV